MSNVNIATDIMCPYYKNTSEGKEYKNYITCEGIETAQYNTTRFKNRSKRDAYIMRHCIHYPNNCPIAAAIDMKYKE